MQVMGKTLSGESIDSLIKDYFLKINMMERNGSVYGNKKISPKIIKPIQIKFQTKSAIICLCEYGS